MYALFNQLLEQLGNNEKAINLITNFVFNDNYNDNIKIAMLEHTRECLAQIETNADTRDIKDVVELTVVKESIDKFNDHLKAQHFNETKKIVSTNKRKREHERERESEQSASSSALSVAQRRIYNPILTPSFNAYCDSTSTSSTATQSSYIIQILSNNIISLAPCAPKVLWKKSQPPELEGKIGSISVSHNAAIFKIQNVVLDECWCTHSLDRSKEHNTRTKMEDNIVTTISEQVLDKTKKIRLVNIGSDKIGLLVILSTLYLRGYKNIDIINLEATDRKYFVDCQQATEDYCRLLNTIFSDATYNFLEVYSPKDTVNLNKDQISSPAAITVFFAEDLGGLDDDKKSDKYLKYNISYRDILQHAVNQVTALLSSAEQNLVFYSLPSGEIKKQHVAATMQQNTVAQQPAVCTI